MMQGNQIDRMSCVTVLVAGYRVKEATLDGEKLGKHRRRIWE